MNSCILTPASTSSKISLQGLKKYFPITPKESPELSYLSIDLIQSPYGIRIYQTSHTQNTIIAQRFPDESDESNSERTPFKEDKTCQISLAENVHATLAEFHLLEER